MSHHPSDPENALLSAGPYRLFFPLGVLNALIGVGYWMLWSVGWIEQSDPFFHASLQVQGFLASFVVGFLMTAMPRFLGAPSATALELALSFLPACFFTLFTLQHSWRMANLFFLLMLASLVPFIFRRFSHRTKTPPGSFLLVGFGLAHALIGVCLFFWSGFGADSVRMMALGRQMLQIGFLLCLVLGIAGHLAPFLMGYADDPRCDPGVSPLRGSGRRSVLVHGLTGGLILASFILGAYAPQTAAWMRAILVSLHLFWFARIGRGVKSKTIHAMFFWVSCGMIPIGLWSVALFPAYRLAGLHLIFIGGFSLMIFCFGLMVVLSHGTRADLLSTRMIPLQVVGYSVLLAAALRFIADVDSWRHYKLWIHLSSGVWFAAALFWLIYIFPKLGLAPSVIPLVISDTRTPAIDDRHIRPTDFSTMTV